MSENVGECSPIWVAALFWETYDNSACRNTAKSSVIGLLSGYILVTNVEQMAYRVAIPERLSRAPCLPSRLRQRVGSSLDMC